MSATESRTEVRYRFGPADPLGIVGTARASQCLVLLAGVGITLAAMYATPAVFAPLAFFPLGLAAAIAFVPFRGAPALDWLRLSVAFGSKRVRGSNRSRSPRPLAGSPLGDDEGPLELPRAWGKLRLVAVP